MSKKALLQLTSRAIALNLVFVSLGWFGSVPMLAFATAHHTSMRASSAYENYLYGYDLISLMTHLALSGLIFAGAVWVCRCGPTVQAFLSPSED